MGPWFIRDETNPFLPGFSLATLRQLVRRGRIAPDTVIKGPSTRQFWSYARNVPGVAHLLGACHVCRAAAKPTDAQCTACGASFEIPDDREHLGLAPVHLLPGHADAAEVAAAASTERPRWPSNPPVAARNGGPEVDAEALIAARHRRRRANRRTTTAIVIVGVGFIGLAIALMVAQSAWRSGRSAEASAGSAPARDGLPKQPPNSKPTEETPSSETGTSAGQMGRTSADSSGVIAGVSPFDLAAGLLSANMDDLPNLIRDAESLVRSLENADPRLAGAIDAAKARLAAVRAGEKL
ncbi:MAG: hypothetical protein KF869_05170 [Phycisphaeraceae bacterium]|nr:hypothetical protein [Phycisphaeraceae bacterium]